MLPLLIHIAAGCEYIHSKNIIHGDLKPDNVLLKTLNRQVAASSSLCFIPHTTTSNGSSEQLRGEGMVAKVRVKGFINMRLCG